MINGLPLEPILENISNMIQNSQNSENYEFSLQKSNGFQINKNQWNDKGVVVTHQVCNYGAFSCFHTGKVILYVFNYGFK